MNTAKSYTTAFENCFCQSFLLTTVVVFISSYLIAFSFHFQIGGRFTITSWLQTNRRSCTTPWSSSALTLSWKQSGHNGDTIPRTKMNKAEVATTTSFYVFSTITICRYSIHQNLNDSRDLSEKKSLTHFSVVTYVLFPQLIPNSGRSWDIV